MTNILDMHIESEPPTPSNFLQVSCDQNVVLQQRLYHSPTELAIYLHPTQLFNLFSSGYKTGLQSTCPLINPPDYTPISLQRN